MRRIEDVTGQRFGRLVAIHQAGRDKKGRIVYLCLCDCGKETFTLGSDLRRGTSQSCGCLRAERHLQKITTHGGKKHPLYSTWSRMLDRCYKKEDKGYSNYGGRGISVCEEWRNSPIPFYSYVESLPNYGETGRSLDRIDNNSNYEPGNIRWATKTQQARNSRNNHNLDFQEKTQSVSAWAEETGFGSGTIIKRLKRGWDIEKTLTEPLRPGRNGRTKGWSQVQEEAA